MKLIPTEQYKTENIKLQIISLREDENRGVHNTGNTADLLQKVIFL